MFYKPETKLFQSKERTNRYLWEVLPDKSWEGKPCIIIGGGSSLKNFDWNLLTGWRTIGVNRAFEKFTPTITFSMDTRFLMWVKSARYGKESADRFATLSSYKVWLITYPVSLPRDIFIIPVKGNYKEGHYSFTSRMTGGIGHGNNSGYGALNLAVCLRANPIYLLGYDFYHETIRDTAGQTFLKSHWHEGHPMPQYESTVEKFIHYFDLAKPKIDALGVKVINLNPKSALKCFKRQAAEKILNP